jgi:RNA polymerase sigma-70 factor (ECF subfamily)
VDVRSGAEFACGHIPGAVNIPMDQIESRLGDLGLNLPIVLVCQSGKRARMTAGLLEPCQRQITVLEGGTKAWIEAQLPVVASVKTRWSLERQVRLGAGLLVLTGAILALAVNPRWLFLCGFVGLGLTFAGLTDICAMGIILEKMPWNKLSQYKIAVRMRNNPGLVDDACHAVEAEQCHNGSVDFDALARQHKDAVYRQMIRVCGNREDAEDVLIEALLKAYRHLDQLRESDAFRAWLAQIAKRVCWQLKERESLLPLLQLSMLEDEGRELPGTEPPPDVQLARQQMKQLLNEAIDALPALYRPAYELRDVEDLPGGEVARRLGISRAAMKSRLHRARNLVRVHLDAALARQVAK